MQKDPQLTFIQVVNDFLNLLLDEGGMDTASPEVRAQMFNDLRARLDEKIFVSILARLDDEKVSEFKKLSENQAAGEELEKFIEKNVPDAQDYFAEIFMKFRKDYLGIN